MHTKEFSLILIYSERMHGLYSEKQIEKTGASFGANMIGANTNNENGKTGAGENPTRSLLLSEITQGDYFTKMSFSLAHSSRTMQQFSSHLESNLSG